MDAEIRRYWGVSRLTLGRWCVVGYLAGAGFSLVLASLFDGRTSAALHLFGIAALCLAFARYRQYLALRPLHRYLEHREGVVTIRLPKDGRWPIVPASACTGGFLWLAAKEGIGDEIWWLPTEAVYAVAGCALFSLPFQVRALCRRAQLILHPGGIVYEGVTHVAGAAWEEVDVTAADYEWCRTSQQVVFHLPVRPDASSYVSRRRSWILRFDPRPRPWELAIPMSALPEPRRVMALVTELGSADTEEQRAQTLAEADRLATPPVR